MSRRRVVKKDYRSSYTNRKVDMGRVAILGLGVVGILAVILLLINIFSPKLKFEKDLTVQLNSYFDPYSIIKKVKGGHVEDVDVNVDTIDTSKLGEHTLVYTYKEEDFTVTVEVVDKEAPVLEVVKGETDAGIMIDVMSLVKEVKDDTEVTVEFKKNYKFKKEGTETCVIVAKDAHGNKTEKEVEVKVYPKDTEAPTIKGGKLGIITQYSEFDPLDGMKGVDNQTKNVTLNVLSNNVNTSVQGTYLVEYEAIDRSNNKTKFTRKIKVVSYAPVYPGEKIVYLTFDDGPSYVTGDILKTLKKYNVKATFFVIGTTGEEYHHYIKEAYEDGHTIALHTYSHEYYDVYASVDAYYKDLKKISDLVEDLTGFKSPYVRFPGGSSNTISAGYTPGIMSYLAEDLHKKGYEFYDWNVSSGDADGIGVPTQTIIDYSTNVADGTVMILFHDTFSKDTTAEALPTIIEYYLDLGYEFRVIDEDTDGFHHGTNN